MIYANFKLFDIKNEQKSVIYLVNLRKICIFVPIKTQIHAAKKQKIL